jgi:hypothetical protein
MVIYAILNMPLSAGASVIGAILAGLLLGRWMTRDDRGDR